MSFFTKHLTRQQATKQALNRPFKISTPIVNLNIIKLTFRVYIAHFTGMINSKV
jgi:hypothetical protein